MVQNSDLSIILGSSSVCDITGDYIEDMDIKIRMFERLELSEKGLRRLEELRKDEENISGCDSCFKTNKPGIVIEREKEYGENRFCLCSECSKEAYEKAMFMLESLRGNLVYKDKSGFSIYNDRVCIFDSVRRKTSESDMFFIIGYDDKGSMSIKADISQIERVSKGLQNPSESDFIERMTLSDECTVCGKENSKYKVHVSHICESCASEIGSSMEDYLRKNPEEIMSQMI